MHKKQKGFTLIELLIVIAIIGVLASIVLVSLTSARDKAREAAYIAYVAQMLTVVESIVAEAGFSDLNNVGSTCLGDYEHPDAQHPPNGNNCYANIRATSVLNDRLREFTDLPPGQVSPHSSGNHGGLHYWLYKPTGRPSSAARIIVVVYVGPGRQHMCEKFGLIEDPDLPTDTYSASAIDGVRYGNGSCIGGIYLN